MTISERQFALLKEMGIPLWQSRLSPENDSISTQRELDNKTTTLAINFSELTQNQLFIDIINSINLSIGEVKCDNNRLDLGLFNWQFKDSSDVIFSNNTLTTPSIDKIAESPQLKSLLWKNICEQKIS